MDRPSPVDSKAAERALLREPFSGRASGTRRIVTREHSVTASETKVEQLPGRSRLRSSVQRVLDGCYTLDQRLRGRLLWLLVAGATAAGAALPLCLVWPEGKLPGAPALQVLALLLAGVTWVSRCRPKGESWQPESVRSRLSALPQRMSLDVRSLRRAPKSLKLSILSRWAQGAGLLGLSCSSALAVAGQLLGQPLGPVLAGLSLWSASLLLLSQLLRWALRLQAPQPSPAGADLALAAREFGPVVDLARPLEIESVFMEPTILHQVMAALSTWRTGGQGCTAEDHALALQHHLWASTLPDAHLELRRPLGERAAGGVADLVVDDAVLVDFQIGLEPSGVQRVAERLRGYRRAWVDKPIVLVVCDARGSALPDPAALEALAARQELAPMLIASSHQPPAPELTAARASAS